MILGSLIARIGKADVHCVVGPVVGGFEHLGEAEGEVREEVAFVTSGVSLDAFGKSWGGAYLLPASMSRTDTSGSSESRDARTQPAVPRGQVTT